MRQMKRSFRAMVNACVLLGAAAACADKEPFEPTPEAAKKFLKLRGYDFDEPSFFRAAAAGDAMAVNGFITAGINVNAHDDNGDTVLTSAAARGDLPMVNVLMKAGADPNAKGRSGWTALPLALSYERNEVSDRLLQEPNVDLKAESPD